MAGRLVIILLMLLSFLVPVEGRGGDRFKISLVTMYPGDGLFTGFGHVALRIQDQVTGQDLSFDYGTYDSSDPLMAWKFLVGSLKYYCSRNNFTEMVEWYKDDFGGVLEQDLKLDDQQISTLLTVLLHDSLPENSAYQYHHFHNNCATKLRDLLDQVVHGELKAQTGGSAGASFRDLINASMFRPLFAPTRWIVFGLLAGEIDRDISRWERMFLPWYLAEEMKTLQVDGKPIVTASRVLVEGRMDEPPAPAPWPGILVLILLGGLGIWPALLRKGARIFGLELALMGLSSILYSAIILVGWTQSPYPETGNNWLLVLFSPLALPILFRGIQASLGNLKSCLAGVMLIIAAAGTGLLIAEASGLIAQVVWPYAVGTIIFTTTSAISIRVLTRGNCEQGCGGEK